MNRKWLRITLSVIVLLTIAIAATACGGEDSGTSTTVTEVPGTTEGAQTTATTSGASTTATGPIVTQATAPSTTAAAVGGWVEVASLSGKDNKQGEPFALSGAPARLSYKVTGSSSVIAAFYVMAEGTSFEEVGGIPEVMASDSGEDSTMLAKDAGNYYLEVKAANCDWEVIVEEQQ